LSFSKRNNLDFPKCNKDEIRAAGRSWRKSLSIFCNDENTTLSELKRNSAGLWKSSSAFSKVKGNLQWARTL